MARLKLRQLDPSGAATGDVPTFDGTKWAPAAGGGGGGSGWGNDVTLGLSTLTGWTVGTGTWSAASGVINQSDTSANARRLHLDTVVRQGRLVVEVDIKVNTATSTTQSRGGLVIGTPAAADGNNGDGIFFETQGSTTQVARIHTERDALVNWVNKTLPAPIATGTWMTLRLVKAGTDYAVYVNGTLLYNFRADATVKEMGRIALYSYAADVSFRNLDIWTPTLP